VYQQSFLPPSLAGLVLTCRPDVSLYRQLHEQFGERAVVSRETLQPLAMSAALLEMRRVVPEGPLAIFTFDPRLSEPWWFGTYFPLL
jgi:hypothetical protein